MDRFKCPICYEFFSITDGIIYCNDFVGSTGTTNHGICVNCIRSLAKAATGDAPVAKGGMGLPCPSCDNVILIDQDIHHALTTRLQHESIVEAGFSDISICSACGIEAWVDRDTNFFTCSCGRVQCRNCPRIYDESHMGVSCAELDKQQSPTLEARLSEVAIRVCSKCKLRFIQGDGCNKMKCPCGASQCYVCKKNVKDYSHFCRCGWKGPDGQCPKCHKSCPLYGAARHKDDMMMKELTSQFNGIEDKPGLPKKSRSIFRNLIRFSRESRHKKL